MKKTIISLIISLTIFALQSCRENEIDQTYDMEIKKAEKIDKSAYMRTTNDSTTTGHFSDGMGEEDLGDPPPKDRGQWKLCGCN